MPSRTFTIKVEAEQANLLAEALTAYAYAAFPPGGSECAQVSRETLLESARLLVGQATTDAGAQLRRRQRGVFKSALQWYFSQDGPGDPARCGELLALFP